MLVRGLHRHQQALDLVEVPPVGQRVVDQGADPRLGVYEVHRPHGLGVARPRLHHPVAVGHLHGEVGDDREPDVHVLAALPLDALLDGA